MFKLLYTAQLGINALLIYSWASLFFLPAGARDARLSYKLNTGLVVLVFCIISGLVWYFQKSSDQRTASLVLYGFYGVLLCYLLWLMKNGTWR